MYPCANPTDFSLEHSGSHRSRKRPPMTPQAGTPEPAASARAAGLRYVSDAAPGIRRLSVGGGFRYIDAEGKPMRDRQTLDRIKSLAIPPAWRNVWICPSPAGHLQATGLDDRGRKQYRYHPAWRGVRDATKFHRLAAFGAALGKLRADVDRALGLPGLPRDKVLAAVLRLLDV